MDGVCDTCGKPIQYKPSATVWPHHYCSRTCFGKANSIRQKADPDLHAKMERMQHLQKRQSLAERFWAHVKETDDDSCWEYGAQKDGNYGAVTLKVNGVRKRIKAHRIAWMLTYGDIPKGLFVCHHCDNPPCVRPDHLFLGTNGDNVRDMVKKGRDRPQGRRR